LPGKIRPRNDLLCVEWDVTLLNLTHRYLVFFSAQQSDLQRLLRRAILNRIAHHTTCSRVSSGAYLLFRCWTEQKFI